MNRSREFQLGFTLVEILVTVVILAVGLLGVATLQFMSKRSNFEAAQRTTAAMLAYDIIERMRSNPKALQSYAGTKEISMPSLGGNTVGSAPTCSSTTDTCNKEELAEHDRWELEQALDGVTEQHKDTSANTGGLVSPTACITTTVPAGLTNRSGRYTVAIAWRGPTALSDPQNPTTPTPSPDPYECGRNSGKYNDDKGTKDVHRRILMIDTYIAEP